MTSEEYALVNGPLDGCNFSLDTDPITNQPAVMALPGQDGLWLVASFDEGGEFIRFLIGERTTVNWNVHQYKHWKPGRYLYNGILIQSDGRTTASEVIRKLKGEDS